MRLILLSLAGAACLTACSPAAEQPAADAVPETPAPAETTPNTTTPSAPAPNTPSPPSESTTPSDACGAAERQSWVGQPRSAVPAAPAGANWRVYETGDILTQDLRSDRLNVEINPSTQRVVSVRCG